MVRILNKGKPIIREFIPPILLRLYHLAHQLRRTAHDNGRECGPEFYDRSFRQADHWHRHYTESRYYSSWAVIADRIARVNPKSVVDVGCGCGQFATLLRDKGIPRYLGVDFMCNDFLVFCNNWFGHGANPL